MKGTGITVTFGESKNFKKSHIVVTSPGFFKNQLEARTKINISQVKMVIFDEADEIFNNIEVLSLIHI